MAGSRLPAVIPPLGPHSDLGARVYHLMLCGRHSEALALADEYEPVVGLLGDLRTVAGIRQARMYSLTRLERLPEALAAGDALVATQRSAGLRVNEAKALADTAEISIKMGRLDDGLYRLAAAIVLLDGAPLSHPRYSAALSSVCGAARSAQLYELAEEMAQLALRACPDNATALSVQRAELLLDWALGLEQIGQTEEAAGYYARSVEQAGRWLAEHPQDADNAPLASANLAVGLAKLGEYPKAEALARSLILPMRAAGNDQEARKAHLAYGVVLRGRGEYAAARRELIAAIELAENSWQRLILQYELALLAAAERSDPAARAIQTALRGQAQHLWRLRLERRLMMRQARRRVELEAAQAAADLAVVQDALTGLGNRRQFDRRLAGVDESYVLALVDIDEFKAINDGYSHQTGDRVLCEVASVLLAHCRAEDSAVRLGGDEFALFLHTDEAGAIQVANRIRDVIRGRDWATFGAGLRVTLSIGLAGYVSGMGGPALYDRADRRLYEAKRAGRDRICAP
jgi:diguanylate cyclase (GGDEF)-like protein